MHELAFRGILTGDTRADVHRILRPTRRPCTYYTKTVSHLGRREIFVRFSFRSRDLTKGKLCRLLRTPLDSVKVQRPNATE